MTGFLDFPQSLEPNGRQYLKLDYNCFLLQHFHYSLIILYDSTQSELLTEWLNNAPNK
jgi:hypothetical protein